LGIVMQLSAEGGVIDVKFDIGLGVGLGPRDEIEALVFGGCQASHRIVPGNMLALSVAKKASGACAKDSGRRPVARISQRLTAA
jgi:hypothetical protein